MYIFLGVCHSPDHSVKADSTPEPWRHPRMFCLSDKRTKGSKGPELKDCKDESSGLWMKQVVVCVVTCKNINIFYYILFYRLDLTEICFSSACTVL